MDNMRFGFGNLPLTLIMIECIYVADVVNVFALGYYRLIRFNHQSFFLLCLQQISCTAFDLLESRHNLRQLSWLSLSSSKLLHTPL